MNDKANSNRESNRYLNIILINKKTYSFNIPTTNKGNNDRGKPFTITIKKIKYLGINLTSNVEILTFFIILLEDMGDMNKLKITPCS